MPLPLDPETRNRLLAAAVLAACALSVGRSGTWQGALRAKALAPALPPLAVLGRARDALRRAADRLASLWHASEEVERLRQEQRALRETIARLQSQLQRSEVRLRDFTAFENYRDRLPERTIRVVPADVVAADPSPWRHEVIVNRGNNDGVREGTPAVWGNSIVGRVVAVQPTAARVRLLNDPLSGLKVRIARTGDVGLLRGTGSRNGLLAVEWLHLNRPRKGDFVVTAGIEPAVPPGLVAAEVVRASTRKPHLFFQAEARPLIELDRLSELLLVVYIPADVEKLTE